MDYTLKINLSPNLDAAKFNAILQQMKASLGVLGSEIKPIDFDAFNSEMAKFTNSVEDGFGDASDGVEKLGDETGRAGDEFERGGQKAKSFIDKLASFGLAANAIQQISNSLATFTNGYVALDTATQQMKTLGSEAEAMAPKLRDAAIEMSTKLPYAADQIQTAMFNAMASGVQGGEEGLKKFAETAAKLATGGGADLEGATAGLGALLNAFGATSNEATKYADILFNTVNYGVTSIKDLNQYLSQVTPTAASAGIGLDNVGAAMALMTQKGVPTAQAATKLNSLLNELIKPTTNLAPAMKNAGISMDSLKNDELPVTLAKLQKALTDTGMTANQAFSSSEAAAAFNVLMGQAGQFDEMLNDVANTSGSAENAYRKMADSNVVKSEQMKAIINAAFVKINDVMGAGFSQAVNAAQQLAPLVITLGGLASVIPDSAVKNISDFGVGLLNKVVPGLLVTDAATQKTTFSTEALTFSNIKAGAAQLYSSAAAKADAAVKYLQTSATGMATTAQNALNSSMLMNPFVLVAASVVALAGGLYLLYQNSKPVREFFDTGLTAAKTIFNELGTAVEALGGVLSEVGGFIFDVLVAPLKLNYEIAKQVFEVISGLAGKLLGFESVGKMGAAAMAMIKYNIDGIVSSFNSVITYVKGIRAELENVIKFAGEGIGNLLTFNFSGALKSFNKIGSESGKAFNEEFSRQLAQKSWDNESKNLKEGLEKGLTVKAKIDSNAAFENMIVEYEKTQKRINELKSKSPSNLTDGEKTELINLEAQAKRTANSIANIAPETKSNIQTAVNSAGQLVEVYDINIAKAKEFSKENSASKEFAKNADEYSKSLTKQADILGSQKNQLADLKKHIDATNDPAQKEKLLQKYNEELGKINGNKDALINSFVEGGKAGLLTENAYAKIAQQLGITNEEAKKMVLAKVLAEATKSGELHEEQIKKIAKEQGTTEENINKILAEQKAVTAETGKTADKAKGWNEILADVKKSQEGAKSAIIQAQLDLQKGNITEAEYQKKVNENLDKYKKSQQEGVEIQKAANAVKRQHGELAAFELNENKKSTKEQKTQFEIETEKFNRNNELQKQLEKETQINEKLAQSSSEANLNEFQQQAKKIELLKNSQFEAQRVVSAYQSIYELAKKQYDSENAKGKVSEKTLKQYDEAKKKLQELNIASKESQIAVIDAEINLKINKEKADSEAEQIRNEIAQKGLEYNVKIGVVAESELLKTQIAKAEEQIKTLAGEIQIEMSLGSDADVVKIAKTEQKIQELKQSVVGLNESLIDKQASERINAIEDLALMQREVSLKEAEKTYNEDLKKAGANNALKEKAYTDFVNKKFEIDQQYLAKSTRLQDVALTSAQAFAKAFADSMIAESINPVQDAIDKLKKQLESANNVEAKKADTSAIEEEEKAVVESYKKRVISAREMEEKLDELRKKRGETTKTEEKTTSATLVQMQLGAVQGFQAVQQSFNTKTQESSKKLSDTLKKNLDKHEKDNKSSAISLTELLKGSSDVLTQYAEDSAGLAAANFGAMLASGQSFAESFKQAILGTAVQQAESLILINIPVIFSTFSKLLGPFGWPAATLAIGSIYALLGAAKGALGRKDGEVDIEGSGTSTSDDNIRFVSKNESIMTAKATHAKHSIELYTWQNKTGGSAFDYFTKVNPAPLQRFIDDNIKPKIYNEIMEKKTALIFENPEIMEKTKQIISEKIVYNEKTEVLNFKELLQEVKDLKEETKKGNFMRKEHSTVDLQIEVNDKAFFEKIQKKNERRIRKL